MTEPPDRDDDGADAPPPGPRVPVPGEAVQYRGREARVLKAHPPGGPDAALDLVVYHGTAPEALARVPHDPEDGWCWPGEAPPAPPTPGELLAAARASGARVPAVGERVVYIRQAVDASHERYVGDRARVVAVRSPTAVDLEVFAEPEPPGDTREPDPPYDTHLNLARGTRGHSWAFRDEWSPPEPRPHHRALERPCSRCGGPADNLAGLYAKDRSGGFDEVARLCGGCDAEVRAFLAARPASSPA